MSFDPHGELCRPSCDVLVPTFSPDAVTVVMSVAGVAQAECIHCIAASDLSVNCRHIVTCHAKRCIPLVWLQLDNRSLELMKPSVRLQGG